MVEAEAEEVEPVECVTNFNTMEVLVVEVNTHSSVKQRNKKNITRLEKYLTVPEK